MRPVNGDSIKYRTSEEIVFSLCISLWVILYILWALNLRNPTIYKKDKSSGCSAKSKWIALILPLFDLSVSQGIFEGQIFFNFFYCCSIIVVCISPHPSHTHLPPPPPPSPEGQILKPQVLKVCSLPYSPWCHPSSLTDYDHRHVTLPLWQDYQEAHMRKWMY